MIMVGAAEDHGVGGGRRILRPNIVTRRRELTMTHPGDDCGPFDKAVHAAARVRADGVIAFHDVCCDAVGFGFIRK